MSRLIRTAKLLCVAVALFCCSTAMAQDDDKKASKADSSPKQGITGNRYAVKTNLLMDGAGVANLGVEIAACNRLSVDIPVMFSPYAYSDDWSLKVIALQPEVRFWLKNVFSGHFIGVHAEAGIFNVATDSDYRYESYDNEPSWGAGLSYGYAMMLTNHLGLEFTLGAGYIYMKYNKYYNVDGGALIDKAVEKDHWGLTKLGVTLSYSF